MEAVNLATSPLLIAQKTITLTGAGTYNIFQLTGSAIVTHIWGIVTVQIAAATTAACLDLFPTAGAAIQITSAAGTDISALPVGSVLNKGNTAATALTASSSALGYINEQAGLILAPCMLGQKTGVVTHIRFKATEGGTAGAIEWHIEWKKLNSTSLIIPAV